MSPYIPYCGTPPDPAQLWSRWNFDPVLLFALIALAALHAWALARSTPGGRSPQQQRLTFIAGWLAAGLALVSPLCNLSIALFSARVGQHMWLVLIAAPLIATGRPTHSLIALLPRPLGIALERCVASPVAAAVAFGVLLWLWHLPRPYQWTFESHVAYWLMHITLTGSALLLWESFFSTDRERLLVRLFAGFATLLHMGLLGALITLTPRILYPVHLLTTQTWNLQPIEDQQLGGLIMWIPGCTVLALLLLIKFSGVLKQPPKTDSSSPGERVVGSSSCSTIAANRYGL